jgi:hypothetical protein
MIPSHSIEFIKFLIPRPLAAGLPIKKGPGLALGFNTFYIKKDLDNGFLS